VATPGGVRDARARAVRRIAVAVIWLAGLGAGFVAILSAAAGYGCGDSDTGLACRTSGSLLGVLLVVVVIAVVTAVTVATVGRDQRMVFLLGGTGLIALVLCFLAARWLLSTI
jgi:hypothetical protein